MQVQKSENVFVRVNGTDDVHKLHNLFTVRGGQTEMSSDQTIFERTHVLGVLELHGLEKASSALLSGQWSGTCLIRGHFGLGRTDQRSLWSGTV